MSNCSPESQGDLRPNSAEVGIGRGRGQRARPAVTATHNSVLYGVMFTFPSGSAKLLPVVARVELALYCTSFPEILL